MTIHVHSWESSATPAMSRPRSPRARGCMQVMGVHRGHLFRFGQGGGGERVVLHEVECQPRQHEHQGTQDPRTGERDLAPAPSIPQDNDGYE